MARKVFGLILTAALACSWAAPLLAQPEAPSHACCMGGAPMPEPVNGGVPACCRESESLPPVVGAAMAALVPVLLPSVAIAVEPHRVLCVAPARDAAASPQAPPGTHSGLSPPSSGL